jgi:hypothetical protein
MLAAPNTPNLRAPSFFGTCGGLNADHTLLNRAAILPRVSVQETVSNSELRVRREKTQKVCSKLICDEQPGSLILATSSNFSLVSFV